MTDKTDPSADNDVQETVDRLASQLETFETFIARRFDEISAEINATSQQVDMAEDSIVRRFSEILEVLAAISHSGDGTTPANAGVELDAVVDTTESAANQILDAAGRMSTVLEREDLDWTDEQGRNQAISALKKDIDEIYLACSFQDITGQRIRQTLENLQIIEDRLGAALERLGIKIKIADHNPALPQHAANQEEIDALFGGKTSGA